MEGAEAPSVQCPRCGAAAGSSRWCETCGKDLSEAGAPPALPTPESIEAARREAAWLQAHPDVAQAESDDYQVRERAQAELEESSRAQAVVGYEVARDPAMHARVTRLSLIACAVVGVITAALEGWHLSVLADVPEGSFFTSPKLDDSDFRLGIAYLVQFLLLIATAVTFIVWLYRVYSNLKPLGAYELRHGKGWAIGGWFVPILSLWRPKQIVNDAWRASNPELGYWTHLRDWEETAVPALFTLWWILFLVMSTVSRISDRMYRDADTIEAERSATIVSMCSTLLWIAGAVAAVYVVNLITARQADRAAARERMAGLDQAAAGAAVSGPTSPSAQDSSA